MFGTALIEDELALNFDNYYTRIGNELIGFGFLANGNLAFETDQPESHFQRISRILPNVDTPRVQ